MQLRTERLSIRELMPDDWRRMREIAADFRESEYAVYDKPLPSDDAEMIALTEQFAGTRMFYAVLLRDVMIGYICFHEDNGHYDLGFCFHSDYRGKGYAFESCQAMMDYMAKARKIKTRTEKQAGL